MDIEKYLVILKDKECTKDILSLESRGYQYRVTFHNNKTYDYHYRNVRIFKNPIVLDPTEYVVYRGRHPIKNIRKIIVFKPRFCRLIYNSGYDEVYKLHSLVIERSLLSEPRSTSYIDYLKQASNHISVKDEGERSFLYKQFQSLNFIHRESMLAKVIKNDQNFEQYKTEEIIFPFGFNISQKKATELALLNQISVIEGPPGTGKTQTILNIIANAVVQGKTVAVVSNNNSATANVVEKLAKYQFDFLCAFLGSNENRERFFREQTGLYPDFDGWDQPVNYDQVIKLHSELNRMLKYQNSIATISSELKNFQTEYEYFKDYFKQWEESIPLPKKFTLLSSDSILELMIELKYLWMKRKPSLFDKLKMIFSYGFRTAKIMYSDPSYYITSLQNLYYQHRMNELQSEQTRLQKILSQYNFNEKMEEYTELSMKLFQHQLTKRYKERSQRPIFTERELRKDYATFVKEYPVILSTTHSLRNSMQPDFLFDYLIVDEASQVDLVSGMLAFSCAKNVIIVGDTKQLPNIIPNLKFGYLNNIFQKFQLPDALNVVKHSLLSSVINLYPQLPRTLLKEHYRCHPDIIHFCNQKYYNNELIVLTEHRNDFSPLTLYTTAEGNHARGRYNQRQIDVIREEVLPNIPSSDETLSVGIVSPYRDHVEALQREIHDPNIEIDTIHKFQGRERDVIILSTVANEINDFIDDPHLINVAVSRAVKQLCVIVAHGFEDHIGTNIGDLIRYIKYNNFEVIESEIYSAFDLLYSNYSKKLLEKFKDVQRVSEFQSENLINSIINRVLQRNEFQTLSKIIHQPLRMIIKDPSRLTDEEYRYAMNIFTHTDFLIYSKIDKSPILVIEVDGYKYHAQNETQQHRDRMKDTILEKYNIPILRLQTNESREEERIINKLNNILYCIK